MSGRFGGFGIVAKVLLMVVLVEEAACGDQRPPNVLLIVSDDLNCFLGCYGDPRAKTPNIDRLAARGVRFDRAYCTFPLCGPSRNSFLTGLYPNTTGILANSQIFRQTIPAHHSLPQAFRLAGYFAARVGKLFHYDVPRSIGTNGHDDPGSWEMELNPAGCDRMIEEPDIFTLVPGQFGGTLSWYASPRPDALHTDGMLAEDAAWVLERCGRRRERPFFLAVGFFRPHTPYVAPRDPWFGLYPAEEMPLVTGVEEDQADLPPPALGSLKQEEAKLTDQLRRQCIQAYYASISFMDAQVGRVIDALDRHGLADDTIVVFTSDHGYHMGEHGLWQKRSLFEESARVPLVIVAPGIGRPGTVATAPVSQVDLFPTLAALCGVAPPDNLQGQSLVSLLHDPSAAGRGWAVTQVNRSGRGPREPGQPDSGFFGYSLRTPRWRYTEWDEGRRGRELYDHEVDPRELVNLADRVEHAERVAELAALLQEAVASTLPPSGETPTINRGTWAPNLTNP
jgi:arylsulfatase A-like enzyme